MRRIQPLHLPRAVTTIALLALAAPCIASHAFAAPPSGSTTDPHYRAGLGLLERGQPAMALTELDAFLATKPTGPERTSARYAKAICLIELKRGAEAIAELDAVLGTSADATPFEFRGDALLLRARLAFDGGDFASAAQFAGRIASDAPDFAQAPIARQLAGESLLRAGQPAKALAVLDELLATKPAPAIARRSALLAGHAAVALKNDAGAVDRLKLPPREGGTAAELAPIDLLAAQCLHRLGDLPGAFARYRAAADAQPSDDALLGVGQTGRATKQLDRARTALDQLLAADRKLADRTRASATIERARIALEENDAARARALMEGLTPSPENLDRVLSWRANAQSAAGARDAAIETLGEALRSVPTSPLAPAMRFDLAGMLLAEEQWAEAAETYERFLKEAPKHQLAPQAALRRAICFARLGKIDAARTAFAAALEALPANATNERALALAESLELATLAADWSAVESIANELLGVTKDPARRSEALLRQGIAAARQQRPAEAVAAFDQLLKEFPQAASATHASLERAEALLLLGRTKEALADFRRVAEATDARDATLRLAAKARLANVLLRQGDAGDAAALLADADGDALVDLAVAQSLNGAHDQANATLTRFLERSPDSPRAAEAHARRGIARSRLGQPTEALEDLGDLDRVQRTAKGHAGSLSPELAAAAAFERGLVLSALGRKDEALSAFDRLASTPSAYAAFASIELARLLVDAGKDAEAAKALDRCEQSLASARAADKPSIEERSLYFRGLLASRGSKHADAIAALTGLRDRFPASPLLSSARLLLGESLLASGRAADAAAEFEAVLSADPGDAVREPTLLRLGESLAAAQRWAASEKAYSQHLDRYADAPLWHQARFGQGWAREQEGRFDAAIECYRDVVARHDGPTAARAQFQIGECLFAMKKLDDAVREFLKVDVLYAHAEWSAAALYEAGRCFASLGRIDDARAQFTAVRTRFAATKWAELAARDEGRLAPDALPGRDNARSPKGRSSL
jgi:tetratricopeptide (TPR) repeat protein